MNPDPSFRFGNIVSISYLSAIYIFIYLPVVMLVIFSFQDGLLPIPPFKGFSLRWYEAIFANDKLMVAAWNSIAVATISSFIATLLGFLAAFGLARYRIGFARGIEWLLVAPIMVSYLLIGLGLLITFNTIGFPKSLLAVIIGHVVINLPLTFAIMQSQLGAHQANIERAARDLGAPEWKVIAFITTPMVWPALVAAFCLAFTFSWDEFIIAQLLTRFDVTLPVELATLLRRGLNPQTNAAGTLMFAVSMTSVLIIQALFIRRRRRMASRSE